MINVINHEPSQVPSEPITPSQEDLDKLQDFLNKQYVDQIENSVNSEDTETTQNDEVNQNITLEEETINDSPNQPRALS